MEVDLKWSTTKKNPNLYEPRKNEEAPRRKLRTEPSRRFKMEPPVGRALRKFLVLEVARHLEALEFVGLRLVASSAVPGLASDFTELDQSDRNVLQFKTAADSPMADLT